MALLSLLLAGGVPAGQGKVPVALPVQGKSAVRPALIDINSASPAQLKELRGIGQADAERIVAGRPYLSKASLVTSKIIPAGVYLEIRHRIIAIQHGAPRQPVSAQRTAG